MTRRASPERGSPTAFPRATYRLQFGEGFRFGDACSVVPYLAGLGVSHIYASPLLAARAGSTHGYDLVDHGRLNPELGEAADFDALVEALHGHGMGLIMDFVPNHMGIGADNPWWADVLEWGPSSPFASFFDIDWRPLEPSLSRKLLLPVLADHYGLVLERGELSLRLDGERGQLSVWYGEASFPLSPRDYPNILRAASEISEEAERALAPVVASFEEGLRAGRSRRDREARYRRIEASKAELAQTLGESREGSRALASHLRTLEGREGEPESFDALHRILERQAYRLAFWRVAAHEINYRRFFDISDLAGLRMEDPDLFEASHRLVRRLFQEGKLQGLRLDHVDGLRDPRGYLERLRRMAGGGEADGPPPGAPGRPYLIVEKILASHEALRPDWKADGTTGYEFMGSVIRLLVDPAGRKGLKRGYEKFVGREVEFDSILVEAKHLIMRDSLASELTVLANSFNRVAKQDRSTRDYTLTGLRHALSDVVAHFAVYRTYVTERSVSPEDRREIERAIRGARRATRQPDTSIYDFIRDVLTLDLVAARRGGHRRRGVVDSAQRFQQYTGPVMAKAQEDTAFYRYLPLVALNEVGGEPGEFGLSPSRFHAGNLRRLEERPFSMVATATHDHKRGEDVRARLAVLSELPREWNRRARRWARMNRRAKSKVEGRAAPSPNDEYLLYQTVVGAWPAGMEPARSGELDRLRDRIARYMTKAVREAKVWTSWAAPDEEYEEALDAFVHQVLEPERSEPFLRDIAELTERIAPAGAVNGLAQQLLKLTVPGVPDLYQGTETWDLSLVDPDNRRPVDYGSRRDWLDEEPGSPEQWEALLTRWRNGRVKQQVIGRLLRFRRCHPSLFSQGSYHPLEIGGKHAKRVVAFARTRGEATLVIAAPRLIWPLLPATGVPAPEGWDDTALALPGSVADGRLWSVVTDQEIEAGRDGRLPLERAFSPLPLAALVNLPPDGVN